MDVECVPGGSITKVKKHLHDKKDIQNFQTLIIHAGVYDCMMDNDADIIIFPYDLYFWESVKGHLSLIIA